MVGGICKRHKRIIRSKKKYSKELLNKEELIVFNKIDLIEEDQIKKKISIFRKKIDKNVVLMSTIDKKTVSDIKSKLISYVS